MRFCVCVAVCVYACAVYVKQDERKRTHENKDGEGTDCNSVPIHTISQKARLWVNSHSTNDGCTCVESKWELCDLCAKNNSLKLYYSILENLISGVLDGE